MFLYTLLFFLLGTSVFAAPAGKPKTVLGNPGHSDYHKGEEPDKPYYFGLWYPLDPPAGVRIANGQPSF
jgi:hypothetical protein